MPRIWLDYCEFLISQKQITTTRRVFDRALRALPITQHHRIWPPYLEFVKSYNITETALRVFRRYLKVWYLFEVFYFVQSFGHSFVSYVFVFLFKIPKIFPKVMQQWACQIILILRIFEKWKACTVHKNFPGFSWMIFLNS